MGTGSSPRISAGWEAGGDGYVVQSFETAESRSSILSAAHVSAPEVHIELGAMTRELWPRDLLLIRLGLAGAPAVPPPNASPSRSAVETDPDNDPMEVVASVPKWNEAHRCLLASSGGEYADSA